ncbi:MAG: DapH/DapD/GlmU-related protein [Candidatus Kerfeldbacteria bacterium]
MIKTEQYLDLSQTDHEELFDEAQFPWDVLPILHEYIEYALKDGSEMHGDVEQTAYVGKSVIVGKGTVIEPGVVIKGPAIIGENCQIRSGAYIRENVIVGDGCTIGHCSELKNCLLFNGAVVAHFNYVGDSVLGYKSHLGAGAVISNVKAEPSEIKVTTIEQNYDTGLLKFGAIVGDEAEIGANAVLNPGTMIGKRAVVYPTAMIRGVVNSDAIVKVRQKQQVVSKRGINL